MRGRLGLCAVIFLMLGSFAFVLIEEIRYQQARRRGEVIDHLRRRSAQKLEDIKRSVSPRLQIQNMLLDFQRRVTEIFQREKAQKVKTAIFSAHQELFPQGFPRHDWFLTDLGLSRPEVIGSLGNLGMDESLAQALNRFQYDALSAANEQSRIEERLAEILHCPLKLRNVFDPSLSQIHVASCAFSDYLAHNLPHVANKFVCVCRYSVVRK